MKLLIYCLSFLLFWGCTRAVDSPNSKVIIQLPAEATQAYAANSTNKLEAYSEGVFGDSEEDFLGITPNGYTPVSVPSPNQPINCYLVAVKGPEEFMNRNSCKSDSSNGATSISYTFGPKLGLRPAGSTLELEVTPGDNREVLIFGLHATVPAECKDLSLNPKKSFLSHPYFLGKSAPMKFEPGKEVTVPIDLISTLSSEFASKKIDDCKFENDLPPPAATSIQITTQKAPYGYFQQPTAAPVCYPIDIELRTTSSPFSQLGYLSTPITTQINESNGSATPLALYQNYNDCSVNNSASNQLFLDTNISTKRVWSRINPSTESVNLSVAVPLGSNLKNNSTQFNFLLGTPRIIDPALPSKLKTDVCYPLHFYFKFAISGNLDNPTLMDFNPLMLYNIDSQAQISENILYSDVDCNNALIIPYFLSTNRQLLYLKFKSTFFTQKYNLSLLTAAAQVQSLTKYFQVENTANVPTDPPRLSRINLKIKDHFTTNKCIPAHIELLDQYGFPHIDRYNSRSVYLIAENGLKIYLEPSCSSSSFTSYLAEINTFNYGTTVYVNYPTYTSSTPSKELTLTVTDSKTGITNKVNVLVTPP